MRTHPLRLLLFSVSLLLFGCASLPSGPFQDFQQSVAKAQSGLEVQMDRDVAWSREAEIQEVAERKDAKLSGYMLKEAAGFQWTMGRMPDYWGAREVRRALGELNAAFLGYARLLSSAVSGEIADEEKFESLGKQVNQGLRGVEDFLVKSGRLEKDGKRAQGMAGASAGVSEAFRNFARSRRRGDLEAAIEANAPWVKDYSESCLALVGLIRADMKAAYADQMESIQGRWDDKRAPGRATLTRSVFNLNEEYADAMEALQALSDFYGRLPAAHAELGAALRKGSQGKTALAALAESAGRAARQTRELEKAR